MTLCYDIQCIIISLSTKEIKMSSDLPIEWSFLFALTPAELDALLYGE